MASRVNQGLGESIRARCLEIVSGRLSSAESEPTYQELCLFLHGRERQAVTLLRAGRIGWASSEQKAGDQGLAQWIEHTLLLREIQVWLPAPMSGGSHPLVTPASWDQSLWPLQAVHLHIHTYTCIIKPETSLKENKEQETGSQTMLLPLPAPFCESRLRQLAV